MNTRRSHRSGKEAGNPSDSGSTMILGTQPATFQAAQPRDTFENLLTTQSTTTPYERSREELLEEIVRLEAGNRELKGGLSTQRAEGETDDPAQSYDSPSRRRWRRRYTPSSSSGSGGDRPAKRSKADRAKQVPPLPEYHGKNWAEYYSYTSQMEVNCEYKPSIAPTERDKVLYAALPCSKLIKDSWRLRQKADSRLQALPTWKDFKEFLSSLLEHPALRGLL
ncbi:MAG: hypothetical protein M1816_001637 [Peltula sp. TS41687]|nr:MAG: hypothetical protein M1816_001637 [Peltula sp. TS41687]